MRLRQQKTETLTEALEKIDRVVSGLNDALSLEFEVIRK